MNAAIGDVKKPKRLHEKINEYQRSKGAMQKSCHEEIYSLCLPFSEIGSKDKRAGEPSESKRSPPFMYIHNPRGVTSVLPTSWAGIQSDGGRSGVMEMKGPLG
ncbi:hypothetical protein EVAR_82624_1 [Eumeta japonica]|uniref:Uncharacterized protein n=1 Tax=Eumeta variegata TaxID=151549 RepID=A0A4C1X6X0_EUMVA|nr:hypothetical protein EVAR_82624_1 [Eumeta japonica]